MSSHYTALVDACKTVYREQTAYLTSDKKAKVQRWLLDLRLSTRPYFLNEEVGIFDIWSTFRNDDDLFDFVCRGTCLFNLIIEEKTAEGAGGGRDDLNIMAVMIAKSIGAFTVRSRERSGVDENVHDKLPTYDKVKSILFNEKWLLFVLAMEMTISHYLPVPEEV